MNELRISLDKLARSAQMRREAYLDLESSGTLEVLRLLLEEQHKAQIPKGIFTDIIRDSLNKRGFQYPENHSDLGVRDERAVAVVGETYHFVHKFALRNHQYRNPVPLIQLAFNALAPIDDIYTAKFLFAVCALMSKDGTEQHSDVPHIAALFEEVLPELHGEYQTLLKDVKKYDKDASENLRRKSSLDSFYKKSIDMALELTQLVIKYQTRYHKVLKLLERERETREILPDYATIYVPTYIK